MKNEAQKRKVDPHRLVFADKVPMDEHLPDKDLLICLLIRLLLMHTRLRLRHFGLVCL